MQPAGVQGTAALLACDEPVAVGAALEGSAWWKKQLFKKLQKHPFPVFTLSPPLHSLFTAGTLEGI